MMVIFIYVPCLPSTYYHRDERMRMRMRMSTGTMIFDVGRNVFKNGI